MMLFPPTFLPGIALLIGGGVASIASGTAEIIIDKKSSKNLIQKAKEID